MITPLKRFYKLDPHKSRGKCSKCGKIKRVRKMATIKGGFYCSNCKPHIIH